MAVAYGPTSCSSGLVPKSKLLHSPKAQYGFVPKHSRHSGKNNKNLFGCNQLVSREVFFSEARFLLTKYVMAL